MAGSADALVLTAPRRFEPRSFALPEVGDDDCVLRIEACGLCGTDHEQYTGLIPNPEGFIPGHEVVGIVEQAGEAALARWGVAIGDPNCSICHLSSPSTGSHDTHLDAVAYGPHPAGSTNCGECHAANANNTSMGSYATHFNGSATFKTSSGNTAPVKSKGWPSVFHFPSEASYRVVRGSSA